MPAVSRIFVVVLWLALAGAGHAQHDAQGWPGKPVRVIVPFTLGKSPGEFQEFVQAEARRWARIVKEHNVRME